MQETGDLLAGEMSGHMFFKERWYGFDDGVYAGVRLLEILSKQSKTADAVFKALPDSVNTPELKLHIDEERKFKFMAEFKEKATFQEGDVSAIDGVRVDFPEGFGLMRPSNTTPNLVFRFEAETKEGLDKIQNLFRAQLLALDVNLELPF